MSHFYILSQDGRRFQIVKVPFVPCAFKSISIKRLSYSDTCTDRCELKDTSAGFEFLNTPSPVAGRAFLRLLNLERQGVTGKPIEHAAGWWLHALPHHTFVPSSSPSHDKVGDALSRPSALWVPVCQSCGNKVGTLLLQNGPSQSKWWEIGQPSITEGQKKYILNQ